MLSFLFRLRLLLGRLRCFRFGGRLRGRLLFRLIVGLLPGGFQNGPHEDTSTTAHPASTALRSRLLELQLLAAGPGRPDIAGKTSLRQKETF